MESLSIVLKTVEVCNLNCSYCYFFNGIDKSYKKHPPYIARNTIKDIALFLDQALQDFQFDQITIGLHGGEPLLQNKIDFDWMCNQFVKTLNPLTKVYFTLQTNGITLDQGWIDLIQKYNIGVGVSIDGPKAYHDQYRVDHRGKGSYDKVVDRIKFFNKEASARGISKLGALSVVNPAFSAKDTYRHFVDEIGLTSFNFLLPDNNYDVPPDFPPESYGKFMCEVLEEWTKDDNPEIKITFISSLLAIFLGGTSLVYGIGPSNPSSIPLITVASNGDLSPVDELRSTDPSIMHVSNVTSTTLKNFLSLPIFKEILDAQQKLPEICQICCWQSICGSGGIVNRFSMNKRFNNPSIYCEGLKIFYSRLVAYMIKSNFPIQKIKATLCN